MAKRYFTLLSLALMLVLNAYGASPSFSVIPPRRVFEGNKFAVTFRLDNGEGNSLKVSQINGCRLIFGPSTSTSLNYAASSNGQFESFSRIEYTYTYLAEKAGTYTIPEASVIVDGKRYVTKPVRFTVEPASAASAPASSRPVDIDDIETQTSDRKVASNDVFVRIILSRQKVYEQEAIECTIKLYTKYSISEFMPTRQPSFDGFLIQEVDVQPSLNQKENFNGQTYMTAVLKQCIIFPQKAGKLTINSGNYNITVVQYANVNMGGFITMHRPQTREIKVSSNSASVDVMPLPTPTPAGFTGAVGTFSIDTRLVGDKFLTNDAGTLIYTITGTGNIKYIKEPVIDFPTEFEQYTPKSNIDAIVSGPTVTGKMTVEYTFVPQTTGDFAIGSDKFVYFDPSKKEYVSLSTPTYNIKVGKGAGAVPSRDQEEISAKNTDIRHIRLGDKNPGTPTDPVIRSGWFWILMAMPGITLIAVVVFNRRRIKLEADVKGRKLARAGKVARSRLATARKYLEARDADKFYAETLKALTGYMSDKFSIATGRLSRDVIDAELETRGADAELRRKVAELLDRCEMARYTPDSAGAIDSVYDEVTATINSIESLKR